MSFYNIGPNNLPQRAEYYHNVFVAEVRIPDSMWLDSWDFDSIAFTDDLTNPFPMMRVFIRDSELELDMDELELDDEELESIDNLGDINELEICYYPHSVVEIQPNGTITWYNMLDYDKGNRWSF